MRPRSPARPWPWTAAGPRGNRRSLSLRCVCPAAGRGRRRCDRRRARDAIAFSDPPARPAASLLPRTVLLTVAVATLAAFASSVGQTFFIGLSGGAIRGDLALSEGGFGTLYSVATVGSAVAMVWAGGLIDRVSARTYLLIAYAGLAAAAVGFALVTAPILLLPVLFGLRLFGQGMLSHGSAVIAGRLPERIRGRALSVAVAGHPVGEAILPALTVAVLAGSGREGLWLGAAGAVGIVAIASLLGLGLAKGPSGGSTAPTGSETAATETAKAAGDRPRVATGPLRMLARDPRFWLLQPALLATAFVGTGILFHQTALGEARSWPLSLFAVALPLYAIGSVAASFLVGWLVDRIGVARLFGWHLVPLAVGAGALALPIPAVAVPAAYLLLGAAAGATAITVTALAVRLYGIETLGRIRAIMAALMVFGTALSPGLFGLAADAGIGWSAILGASAAGTIAAILLARLALRALPPAAD